MKPVDEMKAALRYVLEFDGSPMTKAQYATVCKRARNALNAALQAATGTVPPESSAPAVAAPTLSQEEAQAIVDAHEINLDEGDEETELLRENNPELFVAYERVLKIAGGQ